MQILKSIYQSRINLYNAKTLKSSQFDFIAHLISIYEFMMWWWV